MTIRILIVDDYSIIREGLRGFLSIDPELEVVGEAADGAEAIEKVLAAMRIGLVAHEPGLR